ncbi:MBL fold metallo-hydrolase [Kribbella sp. NPDC048915]|uniref:MBL fold metallo-hydrolase n=1 Tax=Kribbella sp. NPDC048915 TaxID=3155148 RepID=UPI0033ED2D66
MAGDDGLVLVDVGIGPAGGLAAEWLGVSGRLPELLTQVGVEPADVDAVVVTHVHLDHVGWASDGARPAFPKAEYVVQRAEVEHTRTAPTYEQLMRPIEETGQLRTVDGEATISGLRLLPTPGHTPGHQSVITERAILGGDVLVHPAQARWPELTYVYETDPTVATTSRRELLQLAATTGRPIAAAHPHTPLDVGADLSITPRPATSTDACAPYRI